MRHLALITALATFGALTACADTDPIETGFGTASAVVTDDPGSSSALRASDDASYRTLANQHFSGSFSSNAQVEVSADGVTWVALGSPASIQLALQSDGEESVVHANASVPVGTYTRVRLTVAGAQADIDAGATLGGITFNSAVALRVGGADATVVIEKEVEPFTVTASSHARILFDLNSELWVNESNAEDEEVQDEEVEDAAEADRTVDDDPN